MLIFTEKENNIILCQELQKSYLQLSQIEKDNGECCIQLPCTEITGTSLATLGCISSEYRGLIAHWSSLIFLWKHNTKIPQRNIWRVLQLHVKARSHEKQLFVTCTDCCAHDLGCVYWFKLQISRTFLQHSRCTSGVSFCFSVLFSDLFLYLYYILEK